MCTKFCKILIVGGGTAGWLSAAVIAAQYARKGDFGVEISLIESADVETLGVGEGTWPSMRDTLRRIGVSESQFINQCDVSLKQGSKFIGWTHGKTESYYHPFSLPTGLGQVDLPLFWRANKHYGSFNDIFSPQVKLGEFLAPKLLSDPEYTYTYNYAYHLDAGKFCHFLKKHCIQQLGVKHLIGHVKHIHPAADGAIRSLYTEEHGELSADLFIDCSGFAAILLGKHFNIPLVEQSSTLFNDTALAVQVPYHNKTASIQSYTLASATTAGWIWDIGLGSRRGIGHVYSSRYLDEGVATNQLRQYIRAIAGEAAAAKLECKKLNFTPGYRKKLWHKNCVAVGVAAGFIEPLEASALVMIELSARMIADHAPNIPHNMHSIEKRFNQHFSYRWQSIIDFLKLHYAINQRQDAEYWKDHRQSATISHRLAELLALWQWQSPSPYDFPEHSELFSSASFQYVLYGMGYSPPEQALLKRQDSNKAAEKMLSESIKRAKQLSVQLPSNRNLLNSINTVNYRLSFSHV